MKFRFILICLFGVLFMPSEVHAQAERADVRHGNRAFHQGKYPEAEVGYKRAIEKNINSYEANYNLGGALYKQERYDDAIATYEKLVQDGTDVQKQASTYYNMGNTLLKQRNLDKAIEAYKSSLRLVPNDNETKFNLAYAKKLKKEEEDQDNQDNQDDQDNQDNQDDQDNQDNQDDQDKKDDQNKDQDKDDKDEDQNKDKDKEDDQDKDGQKPPEEQSPQPREESERMLKAIQASEDNTKKKVDAEKAAAAATRGGNQW